MTGGGRKVWRFSSIEILDPFDELRGMGIFASPTHREGVSLQIRYIRANLTSCSENQWKVLVDPPHSLRKVGRDLISESTATEGDVRVPQEALP